MLELGAAAGLVLLVDTQRSSWRSQNIPSLIPFSPKLNLVSVLLWGSANFKMYPLTEPPQKKAGLSKMEKILNGTSPASIRM